MSKFALAILASAAILTSGSVNAADLPVPNNYNHVEYKRYGNNYSWTHLNGATPSSGSVSFPPTTTISTVEPKITTQVKLPFDKRGTIPLSQMASIATPISRVNFARAVVAAGKLTTPLGVALTAAELLNYLNQAGVFDVRHTPNGLVGSIIDDTPPSSGSLPLGVEWRLSNAFGDTGWNTPALACRDAALIKQKELLSGWTYKNAFPQASTLPGGGNPFASCQADLFNASGAFVAVNNWNMSKRDIPCPAGYTKSSTGCTADIPTGGHKKEIDEQQIIEKISIPSVWNQSAAEALQKAISLGAPVQTDSPSVSGPSSIPGEKTTSKESVSLNPGTNTPSAPGAENSQPGTKTTTKETKTDVKYSGNNATTTTTTNTTTTITNNVTNITTTIENKTEEKEDDKEEDPPTDTPFKDIPELYKQKYPDGIGGVVTKKMDELKATPLFGLPALLTPSLPSTGSCPSWQLDLSLASWAGYGTHTVQAPCWVWDFGKVVIIISALLLARRLIFGG